MHVSVVLFLLLFGKESKRVETSLTVVGVHQCFEIRLILDGIKVGVTSYRRVIVKTVLEGLLQVHDGL